MLRVACVGVGGYAANYVSAVQALAAEGRAELVAVVERYPDRQRERLEALAARGVAITRDLDELLASIPGLDLVTIGTGLHDHCPMALQAMEAGCHVLTAKPAAVVVQDVDRLVDTSRRTGKILAVDLQHAYSEGAAAIKRATAEEHLGRVERVIVRCVWCRTDAYYQRNDWAGRVRLGDRYVLDGPLNNPHAHYVFNALYFAAPEPGGVATPVQVEAELYRAHDIEGEDTACVRATCDTGAVVLFLSTLAGEGGITRTQIDVHGERGRAEWTFDRCRISCKDGYHLDLATRKTPTMVTVRHVMECLESGRRPLITVEEARQHTLFSNGAYESAGAIHAIPAEYLWVEPLPDGDAATAIVGINDLIERAGDERALFSEMGVLWAVPGRVVDLRGYDRFSLRL